MVLRVVNYLRAILIPVHSNLRFASHVQDAYEKSFGNVACPWHFECRQEPERHEHNGTLTKREIKDAGSEREADGIGRVIQRTMMQASDTSHKQKIERRASLMLIRKSIASY